MQTQGLKAFGRQFSAVEIRWLLLRLACAALWAIELFWVQKLAFPAVPWVRHPLIIQFFRLCLDAIFAFGMVLVLRRAFLVPLLALNLLAMLAVGAYVTHFHRPLMPFTIYYERKEIWTLLPHFWDFVSMGMAAVVMAALAVKLILLWRSGRSPFPQFPRAWLALCFATLYLAAVGVLQFTHLRLNVRPSAGNMRNVYAYGYTLPWLCDMIANRSLQAHARRAEKLLQKHYDRISPLEQPLTIPGHLVILQLESIDGPAIDGRCKEGRIMPFVYQLKTQSMCFRLVAFHFNGSCDMDYATTTFSEPYFGLVPYRLPGMIYTNSLPAFMKRHGFKTYFYHGNGSMFYDRGSVLERLGFDGLFFKEQLANRGFKSSIIGFRDADVLNCALEPLASRAPVCVFAITLDSHVPFKQLEPSEMKLFPEPETDAQRFLNSANHVDGCLRDFVQKLPPGTTLVVYGDHTPALSSPEYRSDVVNGKDYVLCLIYQKGADLAAKQETRDLAIATNGTLNLLDVMSYLRSSIEKQGQPLASGEPGSSANN